MHVSAEWWDRYLASQREWETAERLFVALLDRVKEQTADTRAEEAIARCELQRLYKEWRAVGDAL
jgi:hypothetical protein